MTTKNPAPNGRKPEPNPAPPPKHSDGAYTLLSLRDYFAGQALLAVTAVTGEAWSSEWAGSIAEQSYNIADAMIEERGRR
jgi:hypothetical protein